MKRLKIFSTILCCIVLLGFSVTAYAASQTRAFTYNFKHQLAVKGYYTSNQNSVNFSIHTTSNGGTDGYFTIKQFKYRFWGANTFQRSKVISCGRNQSGSCSLAATKGTKYSYEFWKPTAIGYVVGSGKIKY